MPFQNALIFRTRGFSDRDFRRTAEREGNGYAALHRKSMSRAQRSKAHGNLEEALTPLFETVPAGEVEKRFRGAHAFTAGWSGKLDECGQE